jgi:DNA-binding IclR family transcriptional regulator
VSEWRFLTNHARALIFIAQDPDCRLRDIADALDITERTAYAIVMDLTKEGYVSKEKEGRRNRYSIQTDLPLRGSPGRQRRIGEFVNMFVETN